MHELLKHKGKITFFLFLTEKLYGSDSPHCMEVDGKPFRSHKVSFPVYKEAKKANIRVIAIPIFFDGLFIFLWSWGFREKSSYAA